MWKTGCAQYCADNNVPLYGSYDPAIEGCRKRTFFDGLHCGGTGIERFFPAYRRPWRILRTARWPIRWMSTRAPALMTHNAEPVDP